MFVATLEESANHLGIVSKAQGLLLDDPLALYGNYVNTRTPPIKIYGANLPKLHMLKAEVTPGLDGQTTGIPHKHSRRHSVNVLNKAVGQSIGSFEDRGFKPFDNGFNQPGQQQHGVYLQCFPHDFNLF